MLLVHVCEKQNKETCMSSLYELDQKDTDWTCEMSWGCCPPPTTIHAAHLILIPHWNLIWFSLQVQHHCFSSHLKLKTSHSLDELSLITKACLVLFFTPCWLLYVLTDDSSRFQKLKLPRFNNLYKLSLIDPVRFIFTHNSNVLNNWCNCKKKEAEFILIWATVQIVQIIWSDYTTVTVFAIELMVICL